MMRPAGVEVPDVVGLTTDEAKSEIKTSGLSVGSITKEKTDQQPPDIVIDQNPDAGDRQEEGTPVNLTVADKSEPTVDPLAKKKQICGNYANEAVKQNSENLRNTCKFSGPMWSSDYGYHYNWCMSGGNYKIPASQGSKSRKDALKRCIQTPAKPFHGIWINKDANTRSMPKLDIKQEGNTISVHAWGKCHPTDCDWGVEKGRVRGNSAVIAWDQGFVVRNMKLNLGSGGDLSVVTDSKYKDSRPDRTSVEHFRRQ